MVCLHTDTMGVHPACILFDGQGYSPPRPGIPPETTPPILHILPLIAHQLASARRKPQRKVRPEGNRPATLQPRPARVDMRCGSGYSPAARRDREATIGLIPTP